MSRFNDVREPIEYVVDQYFLKKKMLKDNTKEDEYNPNGSNYIDDDLPEVPVYIIRDEDKKAYKFIYGNVESLLNEDEESDPIIWQEELVRDSRGKVTSIITTYPDGESVENHLIMKNGRLSEFV